MQPVFDFHVHVFPDFLAAAALAEITSRGGFNTCFNGTADGLRQLMQKNHVAGALVQPVATKPGQVFSINRWHAELNRQPGLKAFGALHPEMSVAEIGAEIEFLRSQGVRGVKLHPEYQDFYPDEDRLEPIYARLKAANLIVLMHAGLDLAFSTPAKATPERLAQVVKSFPGLQLVAAHLGGYGQWEQVGKYLAGLPMYLDTAFCLHEPASRPMLELIQTHGSQRVLFASDAPWGDLETQLQHLQQLPLLPQEIEDIAGKNAYNLLGA